MHPVTEERPARVSTGAETDPNAAFRADVHAALARRPRSISAKYFYDAEGSRLFERICTLPEYYPTRTEMSILAAIGPELRAQLGPGCRLVELGSGASQKVRLVLDALEAPAAYLPVDISEDYMRAEAAQLAADHPGLPVTPVVADYTQVFHLPEGPGEPVVLFLGSTIGNFTPLDAERFLATLRQSLEGRGRLLIGVDVRKSKDVLEAAYDDAQGVTAAFNLNLLARLERDLGATLTLSDFEHRAWFDETQGRIEMHLRACRATEIVLNGICYTFDIGETLHTENSYKYRLEEFTALAGRAGWQPERLWQDPDRLFSLHLLHST